MAQEFTNVSCGDDYTAAATIRDVFGSGGGVFQVADQPAKYQLQYGGQGDDFWTDEATIGTGGGSIPAGVTGIRFKNATAGVVATVSALIRVARQPHLSLTFSGAQSVSVLQRVSALPSSPVDTQIVAYQPNATSFPGVEWLCIFNSTSGWWDVIGGAPLSVSPNAVAFAASVVWQVQAGAANLIAVPNQGDYFMELITRVNDSGDANNNPTQFAFSSSGAAPAGKQTWFRAPQHYNGVTDATWGAVYFASAADLLTGVAAATTIGLAVNNNNRAMNCDQTFITVMPRRIR